MYVRARGEACAGARPRASRRDCSRARKVRGRLRGRSAPRRGNDGLLAPGELFSRLAACRDGGEAIVLLRVEGGFDESFKQADGMGGLDQFEYEVLELAEREAAGSSPKEYPQELEEPARKLRESRDKQNGIELSTIHGAKGRQWPHVILIACDEHTLPHKRSLEVSAEEARRSRPSAGSATWHSRARNSGLISITTTSGRAGSWWRLG
jgi:hypothetical protein